MSTLVARVSAYSMSEPSRSQARNPTPDELRELLSRRRPESGAPSREADEPEWPASQRRGSESQP